MNFTREPIIETIVSPKEGYKLLVRNSKGEASEEYFVDAVEVVSFGRAFFFRSLEKPKAFLVPASDYEILEVKEARVALKNVSHEKTIKIGGGREASVRPVQREPKEVPVAEEAESATPGPEETALETAVESRMDHRKRDRRRHRRRRGSDSQDFSDRHRHDQHEKSSEDNAVTEEENKPAMPTFSSLIPPPPTLISETLSRYREKELAEPKEKPPEQGPNNQSKNEDFGSESTPLHRTKTVEDTTVMNSTYFSPLVGGNDSFF